MAHRGEGFDLHRRPVGHLVAIDDADRLVTGVEDLQRPDDDGLERVPALRPHPHGLRRLLGHGGEAIEVEGQPCEWTDHVLAAVDQAGVERGGVLYVLLLDVLVERRGREVEAAAAHEATVEHGVLVGTAERDQLHVPPVVGEVEGRHPVHHRRREVPCVLETVAQRPELPRKGHPVEPARGR